MKRGLRWTALAAVGAIILAGCSETPKAQYGSAKMTGAKLGLQVPSNGALGGDEWPDACKLLTNDEFVAILPQAKGFKRASVKVTILPDVAQSILEPDDPDNKTTEAPAGGCETWFRLPADYGDEEDNNSSVKVVMGAIADPALIKKHYEESKQGESTGKYSKKYRDLGTSWGAQGCYHAGIIDEVHCYHDQYEFDVSGLTSASSVGEYKEQAKIWQDKVLAQIVRTLAAKMS